MIERYVVYFYCQVFQTLVFNGMTFDEAHELAKTLLKEAIERISQDDNRN